MTSDSLENIRHSLAHVLAYAVLEYDENAKLGIGPAIDNGFYYDIKFSKLLSDAELPKLEKRMHEIVAEGLAFTGEEVSADKARTEFAGQPFKLELIDDLDQKKEKITIYKTGEGFKDLCRGGHVDKTSNIPNDAFVLTHSAGAYWKGSEKNAMLVRIYGLAFLTKEDLEEYILKQEEAKKRDHRLLNEKLDYFMISEEVGKGLPLYLPNGAYIRKKLEDFIYEKEQEHGYHFVYTPVLTHKRLYEQSGHLEHYKDDMYSPIEIDKQEYYLRPMNCPHHHQIYKHKPLSYRDLPLRLAEFGLVHRYERSGVLTGLMRARCFTQNDAHIYCVKGDLKKELVGVLKLFQEVYDEVFGIKEYWFRLSLPDFANEEKFGDIEDKTTWNEATECARGALEDFGANYVEGGGEAAFYGPKIDVQIRNVNGKEDTIATIQVDFYSSNRFDLVFTNKEGKKEQPVIVHRAIMGSFERFFAFLIEQYAGAFPVWLSPVHVAVLPVSKNHTAFADEVVQRLKSKGIQVMLYGCKDSLGKRIREAKGSKVPYMVVIGDEEVQKGDLAIESRDKGKQNNMSIDDFTASVLQQIERRSK